MVLLCLTGFYLQVKTSMPVHSSDFNSAPTLPSSRNFFLGVYQIYWGFERFSKAMEERIASYGVMPEIVMFYRDLRRPFPAEAIKLIESYGSKAMINLELWHWGDSKNESRPIIGIFPWKRFFQSLSQRLLSLEGIYPFG